MIKAIMRWFYTIQLNKELKKYGVVKIKKPGIYKFTIQGTGMKKRKISIINPR